MFTFVTIYIIRLYYPKWMEQFRLYADKSRRGNYGRWAMSQSWQGEKPFTFSYS
ncbi:hypothetical protein MKQ68_00150 [Chitinophaga horti]|uniref:Uncharacterized protein n=1 Tax=Chitinophaga horti TaxID=2920382 RepID=A0ABY6J1K3_9BACT|nr:hypothetical protein [Chitinophaga horti]UYQ93510.1 hypothetical protein MKQ68_00150 [Chitinophaga horti]